MENPNAAQEYRIDDGEWQKPVVGENGQVQMIFDGLDSARLYQVRTRLGEVDPTGDQSGKAASPASDPVPAQTLKAPQDPPAAPELTAGIGSISLNAKNGTEYLLWKKTSGENDNSPNPGNAVWISGSGSTGLTFRDNDGNRIEPDLSALGFTVTHEDNVEEIKFCHSCIGCHRKSESCKRISDPGRRS